MVGAIRGGISTDPALAADSELSAEWGPETKKVTAHQETKIRAETHPSTGTNAKNGVVYEKWGEKGIITLSNQSPKLSDFSFEATTHANENTVVHELGHVLGLDHNEKSLSIMSSKPKAGTYTPQPYDIADWRRSTARSPSPFRRLCHCRTQILASSCSMRSPLPQWSQSSRRFPPARRISTSDGSTPIAGSPLATTHQMIRKPRLMRPPHTTRRAFGRRAPTGTSASSADAPSTRAYIRAAQSMSTAR